MLSNIFTPKTLGSFNFLPPQTLISLISMFSHFSHPSRETTFLLILPVTMAAVFVVVVPVGLLVLDLLFMMALMLSLFMNVVMLDIFLATLNVLVQALRHGDVVTLRTIFLPRIGTLCFPKLSKSLKSTWKSLLLQVRLLILVLGQAPVPSVFNCWVPIQPSFRYSTSR